MEMVAGGDRDLHHHFCSHIKSASRRLKELKDQEKCDHLRHPQPAISGLINNSKTRKPRTECAAWRNLRPCLAQKFPMGGDEALRLLLFLLLPAGGGVSLRLDSGFPLSFPKL